MLDGYDEFNCKLTRHEVPGEQLDPETSLPVANLISALLYRQLLPGCTVLVTCRVRDVMDLNDVSDKSGQLMGWDRHQIKEYVDNFFGVKGKECSCFYIDEVIFVILYNSYRDRFMKVNYTYYYNIYHTHTHTLTALLLVLFPSLSTVTSPHLFIMRVCCSDSHCNTEILCIWDTQEKLKIDFKQISTWASSYFEYLQNLNYVNRLLF